MTPKGTEFSAKGTNIVYNHRVQKLQRIANSNWLIDGEYECKNVIIATTVSALRKLLPMHKQIYRQIESQPFMRIYGKFGKESAQIMKEATQGTSVIVNNQIKRIIPINPDAGVYMVVYSDNSNAEYIKDHVKGNNPESRQWLCRKLEQALGLKIDTLKMTAIKTYYWHEGTHYYIPFGGTIGSIGGNATREPNGSIERTDSSTALELNGYETWITKARNPEAGIYVVGEMISRDQGWVEGALQSVELIYNVLQGW